MESRFGELEALQSVRQVLDGFDRAADKWSFSFDGPFWKAVRHAHARGQRGRGRRVALIDSGCDLRIPRLRRCVNKVQSFLPGLEEGDPLGHGTVVALLISEIAPEASLDVYRVAWDDGRVDLAAAHDAIRTAAQSDAAVINLSLGDRKPIEASPGGALPGAWTDPDTIKPSFVCEQSPCRLCQASNEAAEAGKLVFAAVGNSVIEIFCPARALKVTAVGFQRQVRLVPSAGKEIMLGLPLLDEAPYADLFVSQIDGVLGSSFASPLYAGVGALGLRQEELSQYVSSLAASVFPKLWHARADTGDGLGAQPPELLRDLDRRYWGALRKLPHVHCFPQKQPRPELPLTDPADCIFCGFFAEPQYVKLGLWLIQNNEPAKAIALLNAARAFAPWSAEASEFLGGAFLAQGKLRLALRELETAARLRPGHPPYVAALETVRELMSQRGE